MPCAPKWLTLSSRRVLRRSLSKYAARRKRGNCSGRVEENVLRQRNKTVRLNSMENLAQTRGLSQSFGNHIELHQVLPVVAVTGHLIRLGGDNQPWRRRKCCENCRNRYRHFEHHSAVNRSGRWSACCSAMATFFQPGELAREVIRGFLFFDFCFSAFARAAD